MWTAKNRGGGQWSVCNEKDCPIIMVGQAEAEWFARALNTYEKEHPEDSWVSRNMRYEVYPSENTPGVWVVGAVAHPPLGEGEMYMAYFEGPRAKERALEYAIWMSVHKPAPGPGYQGQFQGQTQNRPGHL